MKWRIFIYQINCLMQLFVTQRTIKQNISTINNNNNNNLKMLK